MSQWDMADELIRNLCNENVRLRRSNTLWLLVSFMHLAATLSLFMILVTR